MSLKEDIKKKIPERFHTEPEFKALLEMASLEKITNTRQLITHIEGQIKEIKGWLKEHQGTGGTAIIHIRDKFIKLDTFNQCKEYVEEYLY